MVKLAAQIEGIGLLGPGMDGWTASVALLEGRSPYIQQPTVVPIPEGLPPAERRRIGLVVKLALSVGLQATSKAGVEPDALPAVFASSGGDGENCHEICQALSHDERMISPTRFHNSVHNAAAGYWSIATRSKAGSNAVCAFDWSFTAGLLEAVTQVTVDQTRVLLVAFDAPYPQPLYAKRPIPEPFGVAFVLAPLSAATSSSRGGPQAASAGLDSFGRLTVNLTDSLPDRMSNTDLEALRTSIPAARSLPLLYQLAVRKAGVVNIEYLDGRSLAVEVEPCA
jgi:hypothetical protein